MATNLATLQMYGGHFAQRPASGPLPPQTVSLEDHPMDDTTGQSDIVPLLLPLSAYANEAAGKECAATFVGEFDNDGTGPVAAAAASGQTAWAINGPYTASVGNTLGGINQTSDGRNAPPMRLKLGGAALTAARGGGALTTVTGTLTAGYDPGTPYQTLAQVADFQTEPPDTHYSAVDLVTRITRLLQSPGATYSPGQDTNGQTITLQSCAYSGVGPDCRIICDAPDVGGAANQIPTAVGSNTAALLAAHPSVFFRRTRYTRSVARVYRDDDVINAGTVGQPVRISTLSADPITSDWLFIIDGVAQVVRLGHEGLSLRRPRDIWNAIIVPMVNGAHNLQDLTLLNTYIGSATIANASQLRMEYLEYARCLDVSAQTTDITQTGTAPQ